MIRMPRRSVTRFFIPLIDVLFLLFGIFLLMPFVKEEDSESDASKHSVPDLLQTIDNLEKELELRKQELAKYRHLRDPVAELERLREELKRLTRTKFQSLQRLTRVIDIDPKTGDLFYFDPGNAELPPTPIKSAKDAETLIARLQNQAEGKDLFFWFLTPRVDSGYPTRGQVDQYRKWFAKVANSLQKEDAP